MRESRRCVLLWALTGALAACEGPPTDAGPPPCLNSPPTRAEEATHTAWGAIAGPGDPPGVCWRGGASLDCNCEPNGQCWGWIDPGGVCVGGLAWSGDYIEVAVIPTQPLYRGGLAHELVHARFTREGRPHAAHHGPEFSALEHTAMDALQRMER